MDLETKIPKIAIVLTKKCGKAVVRNKITHQVNAWFLENVNKFSPGCRILRFHSNPKKSLTEILKSVSRNWDVK